MAPRKHPASVQELKPGTMVTLLDATTGSAFYGKVIKVLEGGVKFAPYTKDNLRIARRSIIVTDKSHHVLDVRGRGKAS